MEAFSGDTEESTEDVPGRKKSKLKSLKTRLFGKSKRSGADDSNKLSQSASDITAGKGLGSDEDLACPPGMIASRALSHDSIFLAEQVETDVEPARVLSQENVHSKIKALQMKLQQQKMHLGPPPMVVPIKRPEDLCPESEDSVPHSSPGTSPQGGLIKMISPSAPRPLSPTIKPARPKSLSPTPSGPFPASVASTAPPASVEAPLDFTTPAQFTPCLDSSAARHRMSVKPKNQRASTKKKPTVTQAATLSDTENSSERLESLKEEKQPLSAEEEVDKEQAEVDSLTSSQGLLSKSAEAAAVTAEAAPRPSRPPHQEHVLPATEPSAAPQLLRVKPQRRVDAMSGERPHSSYIESELKEKREGNYEIQIMSHDKRNTLNKAGLTDAPLNPQPASIGPTVAFKSSPVHQQAQVEAESSRGIRRPAPGSGSFHFSINTARHREGERPRSGSFVGVLEQTAARQRTAKETEERALREKEETKGSHLRGSPFAVGRLRPDAAPPKTSVAPWEKRDSLKRVAPRNAASDTRTAEGEQAKGSQEGTEVAEEAKEEEDGDEGKAAFGVKLRSTSQSIRMRSDSCSKTPSRPTPSDEQADTVKRQDASKPAAEKLPASNTKDVRPADPDPAGLPLRVSHNAPSPDGPHVPPAEVQTASSHREAERPQEPQPAPPAAPAEVSWMSLAMEKTKSLQQLFTSRFPRDLTGGQTASRPQTPVASDAATGTPTQTQTGKLQQSATQPSAEKARAEAVQGRNQTQTSKLSTVGVQQKTSVASPALSNTSREQTLRQHTEEQPQSSPAQSGPQTSPWTAQSSLRSSSQTETPAQGSTTQSLAQSYLSSGPQQPAWVKGAPQPVNQLKPAASTSGPAAASAVVPPSVPSAEKGEREASGLREGVSLSTRRTVWTGSVTERAAFLERRAEWKTQPGPNGVDLKKAQLEAQTSTESPPTLAKIPHPSRDPVQEGREGLKLAESSPSNVSERLREDKWLRKNVAQTSSSSPTMPSVLQSMSDSGQPSWMELAKRKSMAWSDKTMD